MAKDIRTKADLVAAGKELGLALSMSALKPDLQKAVAKAERSAKAKASSVRKNGEY